MRRAILILVLAALLASMALPFGSAFAQMQKDEPITFDWFIPDPNYKVPPDDAPIMQQVFEKTGVKFNRIVPPAEPEERYNLMLASGDMPDLISFLDPTIMKRYIDAGKIVKLNDLLEKYAPNAFNVNWAVNAKNKIADDNGDFWFMPERYRFTKAEPEAWASFNVRTDYFEQFGYNQPKTLADFAQLLRDVKAWNPDIIPMGLALGPLGHINEMVMVGSAVNGFGYDSDKADYIFDEKNERLVHYTQLPELKAFFKYLNGLNVEGLIDPESPIMSGEMLKQKAVAKQIWSFIGPWWEIDWEVISYESSIGSKEQSVYLFPTADESVEIGTYSPYEINMAQSGLCITTSCEDPERFMKFYEYANTEEGWMTLNGIVNFKFTGENTIENTEGYDYIVRTDKVVDGKPCFEASAWMGDMWGKDENWYWNRGVERMGAFTYYGLNEMHPNSKYTMLPIDVSVWWDENTTRINNLLGWTGTKYFERMADMGVDISAYKGLLIDPGLPEYTQLLAIRKLHEDTLPRVIMAPTAEAFEQEWDAYVAELNKQGLEAVMDKYNELYRARKAKWAKAAQ